MTLSARRWLFGLGLPLFAVLAGASREVAPVRFRLVEVNTAACEWSGETSFTCREVLAPFELEVRFDERPGASVAVTLDGEPVTSMDRSSSHAFGPAEIAPGPHRLVFALRTDGREDWRREFRIDVGKPVSDSELPPPIVMWAEPAAGSVVAGIVRLQVRAHNPRSLTRAVDGVELFLDGREIQALHHEPWRFAWDSRAVAPGRHVLRARARGSRGLTADAEIQVVVQGERELVAPAWAEIVVGESDGDTKVPLRVPAAATRVTLSSELGLELSGPGSAFGELRDSHGVLEPLFALASEVKPIPFTRDLSAYRGRELELVVGARGGARLTLRHLTVSAYEAP